MTGRANSNQSGTDAAHKDFWQTHPLAVADASRLIGQRFALDACASDAGAAKAGEWLTPEIDALTVDWLPMTSVGAVWLNPPFSNKAAFLVKAHEQAQKLGLTVCCMIPLEPATGWWRKTVDGKATAVFVPDGRYPFIHPVTGELMTQPNFATCFVVFTPLQVPTQYIPFEMTKIKKGGAA